MKVKCLKSEKKARREKTCFRAERNGLQASYIFQMELFAASTY